MEVQNKIKHILVAILATATTLCLSNRAESSTPEGRGGIIFAPTSSQLVQREPEPEDTETRVLVAEVAVKGVEGKLQDLVYEILSTKPGLPTTRSRLTDDVNAIYGTGFFANVTVTPEDTPLGVRISFTVQPNPVLKKVVVQSVTAKEGKGVLPDDEVQRIFSGAFDEILNSKQLQADIQELNAWYKSKGYDLAQVVGAPTIAQDGTVTLLVAEGVIEDIQVRFFSDEGDELEKGKTRPFIIRREVQLQPGDVFNRQTAQRDLNRVFGLGIFQDIKFSFAPGQDPSKVVVNVDVVESNTGSIAAGAGVSSARGLFGTISYQEQNLGGNHQTIGGEIKLGTRELLFDARFTDPWIAGDPNRTSYTVNGFRRRSISLIFDNGETDVNLPNGDRPRVVRTGGGVSFSRPLVRDVFSRPNWLLSLGLQYQRVAIEDSDGEVSPFDELGNQLAFNTDGTDDLFQLQFGASLDRRNNPRQPTSGYLLRFGVDQSLPIGDGSILLNRLRGSYSYYIPLQLINFNDGPQALAFNIQAGNVFGDLPPYEAFSIGGSNSVRGYNEGEVGAGRRYLQATAEYRLPIFSFLGAAFFVDYATDFTSGDAVPGNPAGVRGKPGNGLGYGIGVRIQSPLGPIRVDWGFNDQGDNRIHFGIGERF